MTAYRGNYELMPGNRITVTDAKDTLSLSTTNVKVLCTSSAINPWVRYKPVGYPGKGPDKWWKGIKYFTKNNKR